MIELTTIPDNFLLDGQIIGLAPGSYDPLPENPKDPNYPMALATLEAKLIAVRHLAQNPAPPSLAELKNSLRIAVITQQQLELARGFSVGGERIASTQADREDMLYNATQLLRGRSLDPDYRIITHDGDVIAPTLTQFNAAYNAYGDRLTAVRKRTYRLFEAIRDAQSPAELAVINPQRGSIDGSAGWPA